MSRMASDSVSGIFGLKTRQKGLKNAIQIAKARVFAVFSTCFNDVLACVRPQFPKHAIAREFRHQIRILQHLFAKKTSFIRSNGALLRRVWLICEIKSGSKVAKIAV